MRFVVHSAVSVFFSSSGTDILATVTPIGVNYLHGGSLELSSRQVFSPLGGDGQGQERDSGGPFLASQIPIFATRLRIS